jgi:UDP-N-acetyl-alpha-D-muramoyl-L-alanyl-L-glutamate epimerase
LNRTNQQRNFCELREKFPFFVYQSYNIAFEENSIELKFNFSLANKFIFKPSLSIPNRAFYHIKGIDRESLEQLAFHIGMIELISYWKAACSPILIIKPFHLNDDQVKWWKHIYFQGLGEFFYLNGIDTTEEEFMKIEIASDRVSRPAVNQLSNKYLVPVGGGKDSAVSLELLHKSSLDLVPFIINPRGASSGSARIAGFTEDHTAIVNRHLDPALLKLNEEGFLNGHTPFSALLAFVSVLIATVSGCRHIALSNESSANEPTVANSQVNHQYSKSVEFEKYFREYCRTYLHPDINYFSLLRPLNELQIVKIFSNSPQYFSTFKSCNAGSKTDSWCGKCPKCLFTYLMLSPFVHEERILNIFGESLLEKQELRPLLDELRGLTQAKPFECVGTVDEVNAVVQLLAQKFGTHDSPALLKSIRPVETTSIAEAKFNDLLTHFDEQHFLSEELVLLLKQALHD